MIKEIQSPHLPFLSSIYSSLFQHPFTYSCLKLTSYCWLCSCKVNMSEENDGHGTWRCTEGVGGVVATTKGGGCGHSGIMLFGVRVSTEGSFRKSASMNNLSQYEQVTSTTTPDNPGAVEAGYASDDVVHQSGRSRERKRGTPWTEEEHRLFLIGLQKVGKGDWRGISRNFVRTRTPTQVASHAQKYFLRRSNQNRRRRRSSLFDITTESQLVGPSTTIDESQVNNEITMSPPPNPDLSYISEKFPVPTCSLSLAPRTTMPEKGETSAESHRPAKPIKPIVPIPPPSSKMAALDLNSVNSTDATLDPLPLSLKLLPMQEEKPSSSFNAMSNGDSIITVA